MKLVHRLAGPALVAALLLPAAAQAGTRSHVRTVVGQASGGDGLFGCRTSGPQPDVRNWFSAAVGIPTEGYTVCNLAGSTIDNIGAGATSAISSATATVNGNTGVADAAAHASYTGIGVSSSGVVSGGPYDLNYHASEGAAFVTDTLTFLANAGTGFVRFGFSIDGTLHGGPKGETFADLAYKLGNGPIYSAFTAAVGQQTNSTRIYAPSTADFTGYTMTLGDIAVDGTVYSFNLPVTFGGAVDFTYALFVASYSGLYGSYVESAFGSTVRLTSIAVVDAQGKPIDFSITSASGTLYDASGAHAAPSGVPEPTSWALLILGFGAAGAALRRRRLAVLPPAHL